MSIYILYLIAFAASEWAQGFFAAEIRPDSTAAANEGH